MSPSFVSVGGLAGGSGGCACCASLLDGLILNRNRHITAPVDRKRFADASLIIRVYGVPEPAPRSARRLSLGRQGTPLPALVRLRYCAPGWWTSARRSKSRGPRCHTGRG